MEGTAVDVTDENVTKTESDMSAGIMEILTDVRERLEMTETAVRERIKVKDELIDRLHEQMERGGQDAAERFTDQLMKAVIKVRNDMRRRMSGNDWMELTADDLRKEYGYLLEDITDLIEQQNIEVYSSAPGDAFDASVHQAKTEITDNPESDKKIKESISEGYRKGNKILLPERVTVYQYKENKENE